MLLSVSATVLLLSCCAETRWRKTYFCMFFFLYINDACLICVFFHQCHMPGKKKKRKTLNKHLTFLRLTLDSSLTPTCLLVFLSSREFLAWTGFFCLIQTNSWCESAKRDVSEQTHKLKLPPDAYKRRREQNISNSPGRFTVTVKQHCLNRTWGQTWPMPRGPLQHRNSVCDLLPGMLIRHSAG